MLKRYEVKIQGINGIVTHNSQTADPLNVWAKRKKLLTGKRKKTDADFLDIRNLEIQSSMYTNREGNKLVIPSRVLEANICEGAASSKERKIALSGLFVDKDAEFLVSGKEMNPQEVLSNEKYWLTTQVVVNRNRVVTSRPIFEDWSARFQVSIEDSIVNESQLKNWLANAGSVKGLCDWRPRYGRFVVESVTKLD